MRGIIIFPVMQQLSFLEIFIHWSYIDTDYYYYLYGKETEWKAHTFFSLICIATHSKSLNSIIHPIAYLNPSS